MTAITSDLIKTKSATLLSQIKRNLMTVGESISLLSGYLNALQDMGAITSAEHSHFMGSFVENILA